MITIETVVLSVPGLTRAELQAWLDADLVRPDRRDGAVVFTSVDLARVRLIVELRRELGVDDTALPLVLSLLDQLYATRHQLRRIIGAADPALRARLAELLDQGGA